MTDLHLDVTTEPDDGVVRLRLRDAEGRHLDGHAVRLGDHPPAMWEGLFDTRSHVRRYAGGTRFTDQPATPQKLLTRLGVFLGRDVLGDGIAGLLHKGIQPRTLVGHLPPTAEDYLAAAFGRVPWEIARPGPDEPPLMHRNLAVRTVLADAADSVPPFVSDSCPRPMARITSAMVLRSASHRSRQPRRKRLDGDDLRRCRVR